MEFDEAQTCERCNIKFWISTSPVLCYECKKWLMEEGKRLLDEERRRKNKRKFNTIY